METHHKEGEYRFPNPIPDKNTDKPLLRDSFEHPADLPSDLKGHPPIKKHITSGQHAAFATIDVQKHQRELASKQTAMNLSFQYDPQKDYTKEYYRIYLANMAIMDMINNLKDDNKNLRDKIEEFKSEKSSRFKTEDRREESDSNDSATEEFSSGRRKKKRRKKEEIERGFACINKECGKSYGYASTDADRKTRSTSTSR